MKSILRIFGVVVAVHVFGIILLLAIPGCSSTRASAPATAEAAPDAVPAASPPVADAPLITAAPTSPAPDIAPSAAPTGGFFSPTRPNSLAASALESEPVADVTPASTYVVARGDSLWTIAKKNHLKVSELAAANKLKSGSPLHLGQKLLIPSKAVTAPAPLAASPAPAATGGAMGGGPAMGAAAPVKSPSAETKYTIRANETLGAIARKFHLRVSDLATRNNISDPQKIRPGQELIIPAGGSLGAKHSAKSSAATAKSAPAASAPVAPPPDQDLDAGAGPGASSAVPVITISPPSGAPSASDAAAPAK